MNDTSTIITKILADPAVQKMLAALSGGLMAAIKRQADKETNKLKLALRIVLYAVGSCLLSYYIVTPSIVGLFHIEEDYPLIYMACAMASIPLVMFLLDIDWNSLLKKRLQK